MEDKFFNNINFGDKFTTRCGEEIVFVRTVGASMCESFHYQFINKEGEFIKLCSDGTTLYSKDRKYDINF